MRLRTHPEGKKKDNQGVSWGENNRHGKGTDPGVDGLAIVVPTELDFERLEIRAVHGDSTAQVWVDLVFYHDPQSR